MTVLYFKRMLIGVGFIAGSMVAPAMAATHGAALPQNPTELIYFDLPRLEVSIGTEGSTFVRVDIALQVARQDIPALEAQMPRIIDQLNVFFPRLSAEDVEQSQNLSFVRQDMVTQLNGVTRPVVIHDVSFQHLLVM